MSVDSALMTRVYNTVPPTKAINKQLDTYTTAALLGAVSTSVATGPAAGAASRGAGIFSASDGSKNIVVGMLGLSPQQMVSSGILKPGSDAVIQAMINRGETDLNKIMPPNLFTGKSGAQNLQVLKSSVGAQAAATVQNMTTTTAVLTTQGIIGPETSLGVATGAVLSAATAGVNATVTAVKTGINGTLASSKAALDSLSSSGAAAVRGSADQVLNNVTGAITGAITGALGAANKAFGDAAGMLAGGLGAAALGVMKSPMAGLSAALSSARSGVDSAISQAKSVADGAFKTIVAGVPKLKAGVPNDIVKIAQEATAKFQVGKGGTDLLNGKLGAGLGKLASGASATLSNAASTAVQSAVNKVTGELQAAAKNVLANPMAAMGKAINVASGTATSATNLLSGGVESVAATAVTQAVNKIPAVANAVSSGMAAIPGGLNVASILNSKIPGIPDIGATVQNQISSATNKFNILGTLAKGGPGALAADAANKLKGAGADVLGKLKGGASLPNLLTQGLPPELSASIASLGSISPNVSLPTFVKTTGVAKAALAKRANLITGKITADIGTAATGLSSAAAAVLDPSSLVKKITSGIPNPMTASATAINAATKGLNVLGRRT